MKREKFDILESTCVPLPLANIDTDQIIPARFLSATSRDGFGENLFRDWRYDKKGNEVKDFVLNRPEYKGAILVTGSNFGCGSSREHAVWAIADYGFRAVVSDSFADIFRNNALNNGLLPVQIPSDSLGELTAQVIANPGMIVRIDLEQQLITAGETGMSVPFGINAFRKQCLLNGLDNIDYLINMRSKIVEYEKSRGGPG
ncbi:3-isopropylmalate dehydratase small subunit [bacterium]|nr:3-isopropylmalate dehydratase small subunit [bacterium]